MQTGLGKFLLEPKKTDFSPQRFVFCEKNGQLRDSRSEEARELTSGLCLILRVRLRHFGLHLLLPGMQFAL